ncbi:MAG TPA: sodium:solute symporter [Leptospiraceae bacterium]|nr:sodium:solute symporter [Leptospiraceae bacterium]HMW04731.1 sodium:solute symporter [Leptospiraceae bacterium]HMX31762.1 sodium:solute symporter [Leptospiraceae bacterium]HMY30568.1 sodium:solute symporter [Leptospiraceae bacterium]HMZ65499.1 sodium:solute symporter [Leptospiraceae bacterium]
MQFSNLDFLVLISYLAIVLLAGLHSSKNDTSKSFFLADKELPWYFIMLSIVATETSSLTFLNIPGLSFKGDFSFLQVAFGYIIGRAFVANFILPLYYKGGYSSVYEWVGEKFGKETQKSVSSVFLITRVLGDGIRLYATSIPIAIIFHGYFQNLVSEETTGILTLFIITMITTLYTVFGGFKSVVVTDSLQFFIYIGGGVFSFVYLMQDLGNHISFSEILSTSLSNGKLNFYQGSTGITTSNFFQKPYFFINGLIGGILLSIGTHGVDQMFAQRLIACKSEKESKLALIGSGILVFLQFVLFLGIGLLLFYKYQGSEIHPDKVFSKYIIENIPTPILGIIVAAILASAMSTLSSSINSMSLSVLFDWMKKNESEHQRVLLSKWISVLWGFVLFGSSLLPYYFSGKTSEGLVEIGLKIASFTFGPLTALFLLVRLKDRFALNLYPSLLIFSLFLSLVTTILFSISLKPAMAYLIPFGIFIFYLTIFTGQFLKPKV